MSFIVFNRTIIFISIYFWQNLPNFGGFQIFKNFVKIPSHSSSLQIFPLLLSILKNCSPFPYLIIAMNNPSWESPNKIPTYSFATYSPNSRHTHFKIFKTFNFHFFSVMLFYSINNNNSKKINHLNKPLPPKFLFLCLCFTIPQTIVYFKKNLLLHKYIWGFQVTKNT